MVGAIGLEPSRWRGVEGRSGEKIGAPPRGSPLGPAEIARGIASSRRPRSARRLTLGQRPVCPLAGGARGAAFVSDSRQLDSFSDSAAEHVGEHLASVAGWRAAGGSAGMAGGSSTGGEGGGRDAQPITSSASANNMSPHPSRLILCNTFHLLRRAVAASFLEPEGLGLRERPLGRLAAFLRHRGPQPGRIAQRGAQARRLHRGARNGHGQGRRSRVHHHPAADHP